MDCTKWLKAAVLLVMLAGSAAAYPQIPETYVGAVDVAGSPAPIGTEVRVESASGDVFITQVYDGSGLFLLDVLIDDTESAADEGATIGEGLTWFVDGVQCSTPAPGTDTATPGGYNPGFTVSSPGSSSTSTTSTVPGTTTTLSGNQSLTQAQEKICNILEQFYDLFLYIASGIGALVIVIQGVVWVASADNSKARNSAKVAIIHAIVGLVIVSIALALVRLALPVGVNCIDTW